MPTVSIALCTYQGERYLSQQLQSILQQTRRPDELVICDDGSCDQTRSILQAFSQSAPFPVVLKLNPERIGVVRNFDQAILACQGDYVALCDQDDQWLPHKLERQMAVLHEHPTNGYACSNASLIDSEGQPMPDDLWSRLHTPHPNEILDWSNQSAGQYLIWTNRITGATMLLRRALYQWMTPIPSSWIHDHWIVAMSEILGGHGLAIPEQLTEYRLHTQQTCGLGIKRNWWNRLTRSARLPVERRQQRRENRLERLHDLLNHLQTNVLPQRPAVAPWIQFVKGELERAEQILEHKQKPWWKRLIDTPAAKKRVA